MILCVHHRKDRDHDAAFVQRIGKVDGKNLASTIGKAEHAHKNMYVFGLDSFQHFQRYERVKLWCLNVGAAIDFMTTADKTVDRKVWDRPSPLQGRHKAGVLLVILRRSLRPWPRRILAVYSKIGLGCWVEGDLSAIC